MFRASFRLLCILLLSLPAMLGCATPLPPTYGTTGSDRALDGNALASGGFYVASWAGSDYGLGDIAGPYQPTVEFTAQCIAAGCPGAQALLDGLLPFEVAGVVLLVAIVGAVVLAKKEV